MRAAIVWSRVDPAEKTQAQSLKDLAKGRM